MFYDYWTFGLWALVWITDILQFIQVLIREHAFSGGHIRERDDSWFFTWVFILRKTNLRAVHIWKKTPSMITHIHTLITQIKQHDGAQCLSAGADITSPSTTQVTIRVLKPSLSAKPDITCCSLFTSSANTLSWESSWCLMFWSLSPLSGSKASFNRSGSPHGSRFFLQQ